MRKTIGILGGMGPLATADLFYKIIRATPAKKDQDHIRVVIDSNPAIPDRTAAILDNGVDPVPEMMKSKKVFEKGRVDFIIIPCNTAHFFYQKLSNFFGIHILNMIQLTVDKVINNYKDIKKAGLLATDGTINSRLYYEAFQEKGIKLVVPTACSQEFVMNAIYDYIKMGDLRTGKKIIKKIAKELFDSGAELIIAGCTEISLVLFQDDLEKPIIDPLQVLADSAVAVALGLNEL
jgi:aspartate racemase